MEWFDEPVNTDLGRTRSETAKRKVTISEESMDSGPYYMNVERVNEDMANMVLEALKRGPVGEFLEPRNFSVVDHEKLDFGLYAQTEAPEPREDVKGPEGINPEQYKDHYTAPMRFRDAWNHPDPFQRKRNSRR